LCDLVGRRVARKGPYAGRDGGQPDVYRRPQRDNVEDQEPPEKVPRGRAPAVRPRDAPRPDEVDMACPHAGCPLARKLQTQKVLIQHLCACEVGAGRATPQETLDKLRMWQCMTCRTLVKVGLGCGCGRLTSGGSLITAADRMGAGPRLIGTAPVRRGEGARRAGTSMRSCPCPALVPSMAEVLSARIGTARHLPGSCVGPVGRTLTALLWAMQGDDPSWEDYHRWACFPKLVLRAGARKGKGHRNQLGADIRGRLGLWEDGKLESLWAAALVATKRDDSGKPGKPRAAPGPGDPGLSRGEIESIRGLVEEGALSKAAAVLVSKGIADVRVGAVSDRLIALHPAHGADLGPQGDLPSHVDTFGGRRRGHIWGSWWRRRSCPSGRGRRRAPRG
jgi:hypothetical protein